MSAKIEYNGSVVATVESGKVATLPVKDKKMATNIKVTAEKDAPILQSKTVTPTKDTQTITPDSGKEGLSQVTVNPIPSDYEIVPDFDDVTGFSVFVEGSEGEVNIGYSVSEKVALPAGSPARLASVSDTNFTANNIVKGKSIFGLVGAYEVPVWDGTGITIA